MSRNKTTKSFIIGLATFGLLLGGTVLTEKQDVVEASAVEQVLATLQFPHQGAEHTNQYTATIRAVYGGYGWDLTSWNDFNGSWNHIRAGRRNAPSVATIVNATAYPEAISRIAVNITQIDYSKINSHTLYVSSDPTFATVEQTITGEPFTVGELQYVVPNPAPNMYYKLEYDIAVAGSNGILRVNRVDYMYDDAGGAFGTLTGIKVNAVNAKTSYYPGEQFSSAGLVVSAIDDAAPANKKGNILAH